MFSSNKHLVDSLISQGVLRSERIINAMKAIDRGHFCQSPNAYMDCPQPIGFNATISAPHMHGYALEALKESLKPGARVLDVGSGSGYLCACMAKLVEGQGGKVFGVEHIPELVESSRQALSSHYNLPVTFVVADGRLGLVDEGPFDAIHVGAGAEQVPTALMDQLKNGGRMVIPAGTPNQTFLLIEKNEKGIVKETPLLHIMYVPLTSKERQTYLLGNNNKKN